MLTVKFGALVLLVILLLICFVLPIALFYLLYRFADCKIKTLAIGALVYIAGSVIIDTVIAMGLGVLGDMETNAAVYLLYAVLLSPAAFIAVSYFAIKRFGADNMKTTGDSMMYSLGYSAAQNIISTGIIGVMYFLTMLNIRDRAGSFIVVSDADYVSYTDAVSSGDIINETVYRQMLSLCNEPMSYYVSFCLHCLWVIAVNAAIFLVLWLAVRNSGRYIVIGYAFVMRLLITLPDLLGRFGLMPGGWLSGLISFVIMIAVWAAAILCRRSFIDIPEESEVTE